MEVFSRKQEASDCGPELSQQPPWEGGEGVVGGVRERERQSLTPVHSSNAVTEKGGHCHRGVWSCMNGPELGLQGWRGEQGGCVCSLQQNTTDRRNARVKSLPH